MLFQSFNNNDKWAEGANYIIIWANGIGKLIRITDDDNFNNVIPTSYTAEQCTLGRGQDPRKTVYDDDN